MLRIPFSLLACGILVALASVTTAGASSTETDEAQNYPFIGEWDCAVAIMRFTADTYSADSDPVGIASVEREGTDYFVTMVDGYSVGVGSITAQTMTWYSPQTGDSFDCQRVN